MIEIGIVVLNYKNYEETIACVKSIITQEKVSPAIAIVDNGSNNDSLKILHEEFDDIESISILGNYKNLGYARGNNIGISFLRKRGIDFIIVCNSDVVFSTNRIVFDMYKMNIDKVGTIIPTIRNLNGTIEMRAQYKSKLFDFRVLKELKKMQSSVAKTSNRNASRNKEMVFLNPGVYDDYYVITGSVFALTPSFFRHYSGLFPETFLYVEELATLLFVHKAGLRCAIAKTDDVIHKGAASTCDSLKAGTEEKRRLIACSARKVEKLVFLPIRILKKKYGAKNDC